MFLRPDSGCRSGKRRALDKILGILSGLFRVGHPLDFVIAKMNRALRFLHDRRSANFGDIPRCGRQAEKITGRWMFFKADHGAGWQAQCRATSAAHILRAKTGTNGKFVETDKEARKIDIESLRILGWFETKNLFKFSHK